MKWEVSIRRHVGFWQDEIFVYRKEHTAHGMFIEFMYPDTGGMCVRRIPWNEGMATPANTPVFLKMDPELMQDFLVSFRNALNEFNLPASDEMRMRGELDATKKHLEDMRDLVMRSVLVQRK